MTDSDSFAVEDELPEGTEELELEEDVEEVSSVIPLSDPDITQAEHEG